MRALEDVEAPKSVEIPKELPKTKSKCSYAESQQASILVPAGINIRSYR